MQKKRLILLSIISLNLMGAQQPPSKPTRIKDPYIPMLAFLDAFIAGGKCISSPSNDVIHFTIPPVMRDFPAGSRPEREFTYPTSQAVQWLEKAYKENEISFTESDHYTQARMRQKLFGLDIHEATRQTFENLSSEEQLNRQLQRTQILRLIFSNDEKSINNEGIKETEKLRKLAQQAFQKASPVLCAAESSEPLSEIIEQYEKGMRRMHTLSPFLCSRFALFQALKKGNSDEINHASQKAFANHEFFPPLKDLLERELPGLVKAYVQRAEKEWREKKT